MNSGQIIKSKSTERFTTVPNSALEDPRLSLKAKGLLCYILRLPSDWIIQKTTLHRNMKDGRDSVLAAFKELEENGYIEVIEVRHQGRFSGFNYVVYDNPSNNQSYVVLPLPENPDTVKPITENPESGSPITENPIPDNPIPENPEILNTILTKDDKTNIPFDSNESKGQTPNKSNNGKGRSRKAPPGPGAPPPLFNGEDQKPKPSCYTRFIEVYFDWYKGMNDGIPPKVDGANGNAAKTLIGYFKDIIKAKGPAPLNDDELENKVIDSWRYVLGSWHKIETFYSGKTRLIDINSNIQTIIKQIKDGTGRKQEPVVTKAADQANRVFGILNSRNNAAGAGGANGEGSSGGAYYEDGVH